MESKNDELRYRHFSHDHLLDYTKLQPHSDATCSGCRQTISPGKFYYKCKLCGFYLHQVCFNMPEDVTHPSDPNHNLTLETFPTHSKVPIKCKSCEKTVKGFYYRCSKCSDYYHTLCLAAPLSMKTPLHRHSLNIEFVPVYDFQCDLCDKPSYSGWVYHCNLCEFDAHLSCVLTNKGTLEQHVEPHDTVTDQVKSNQRRDELMELLTRSSNLPQNQDQSMQSFQLSETCFSIDFQNSLIGNEGDKMEGGRGGGVREVGIPENMRMNGECFEEESRRSEKSRGSSYGRKSSSVSSGAMAHIWTEMEQATEKRNSKTGDTRFESNTVSSAS
ncbi:zinc finger, PHD-type, C1-like, Zinc finger, RING/FYVE/PHD-type [Artemisia annua]|uniref:Zinc finger, PHD-type, C1-like, Zinc finger, RING/FYVE/PHD-type n=1 Tax=Artemisia annua TaxID=35608 RepID=A0A2U1Q5E9_ARTAN|nr:zinc finger, PHD-type, C1-like, Zinc finger, RING/FYVE/PHD-type [Artemisia annua]